MTKAEEREVLQRICDLIKSTGTDSYISMAFRGVPEYAERNIAEDAAYNPIDELASEYNKSMRRDAEMGSKLLNLEHEKNCLEDKLKAKDAEIEKLGHLLDSKTAECEKLKDERDACAESEEYLGGYIDRAEKETAMLKAELKQYIRGDIIAEVRTDELHRIVIERGIYGEFMVGTQEHITADSPCKWEYMSNGWRWHDLDYRKCESDAKETFASYVRLERED